MECALCRLPFDPAAVDEGGGCAGCGLAGTACGKVKCPRCGYENTKPLPDARAAFREFWRRVRDGAPSRGQ